MWAFYWPSIRRAFVIFFDRTDRLQLVIGILLYFLTFISIVNQPVGKWLRATWDGFPEWYGVIPLSALFLYGFLKAVHEKHQRVEEELFTSRTRLSEIERVASNIVYVGMEWVPDEPARLHVLRAIFKNAPVERTETTYARRVTATITFYGMYDDGAPRSLRVIDGRWAEAPEPGEMDFPPNEAPRRLDVLSRRLGQRDRDTRYIKIRLTGVGVDRAFWFTFWDAEPDQPPKFGVWDAPQSQEWRDRF